MTKKIIYLITPRGTVANILRGQGVLFEKGEVTVTEKGKVVSHFTNVHSIKVS